MKQSEIQGHIRVLLRRGWYETLEIQVAIEEATEFEPLLASLCIALNDLLENGEVRWRYRTISLERFKERGGRRVREWTLAPGCGTGKTAKCDENVTHGLDDALAPV